MRAEHKPSSGAAAAAKKEHGATTAAADVTPDSTRPLADVPTTVPELPNAYLVRDEDLLQLKVALLAKDGESGTALTSKKPQNKVGAHGMVSIEYQNLCILVLQTLLTVRFHIAPSYQGGVGKTTLKAALLNALSWVYGVDAATLRTCDEFPAFARALDALEEQHRRAEQRAHQLQLVDRHSEFGRLKARRGLLSRPASRFDIDDSALSSCRLRPESTPSLPSTAATR